MSERAQPWGTGRDTRVQSFRYPPMQPPGPVSADALAWGAAEGRPADDMMAQRERAAAAEAARLEGMEEGRRQAAAEMARHIEQERAAVASALQDFAAGRAAYFCRLESEAARLALSIARRILHREARLDPLLLAGVVRVALDQMQAGTRFVLRTSPESAASWAEFCASQLGGEQTIEVVPDEKLEAHRCLLETEAGSTEISLDDQLREIENGFFDLLQEKAGAKP